MSNYEETTNNVITDDEMTTVQKTTEFGDHLIDLLNSINNRLAFICLCLEDQD